MNTSNILFYIFFPLAILAQVILVTLHYKLKFECGVDIKNPSFKLIRKLIANGMITENSKSHKLIIRMAVLKWVPWIILIPIFHFIYSVFLGHHGAIHPK